MRQPLRLLIPAFIFIAIIILALCWKGLQNLRWGMAETLNWHAERLSKRYSIETGENHKLRELVGSFSERILYGEVPISRGFELLRAFENGPLFASLLFSSAKRKFIDPGNMEQSEKTFYEGIFRLFFQGIKSGKVPLAELKKVRDQLIEERYYYSRTTSGILIPEKIELMREVLAPKSLSTCLEIMEKAIRGKSLTGLNPITPSEELVNAISGNF